MIIIWTWTYTPALVFQNINELRSQISAQTQTWPLWSECHFRAIFAAWLTLSLAGDNNYFEERSLTLLKYKNLKLTTLILCPVQKNNNLVLSVSWRNRGEVRSCDTTKLHDVVPYQATHERATPWTFHICHASDLENQALQRDQHGTNLAPKNSESELSFFWNQCENSRGLQCDYILGKHEQLGKSTVEIYLTTLLLQANLIMTDI